MKIDGPKSNSEISKKKDSKKSSSGDGVFQSMMETGGGAATHQPSGVGLSAGIAGIDALLAAQTAEDPAQEKTKRRMQKRADDILEKLNDLKLGLLNNRVTVGHMISIADVVATHRENIDDPALTAILDEIDLRAHVELAKLKIAEKTQNNNK